MGDALHPVARERIAAAVNELRELAVADFPESLNNGSASPSYMVELGERARAAGAAIVAAASLFQVRVEGPADDQTCETCRAALGSHHLLEAGTMLPPFHRCEKLYPGKTSCRCLVVRA